MNDTYANIDIFLDRAIGSSCQSTSEHNLREIVCHGANTAACVGVPLTVVSIGAAVLLHELQRANGVIPLARGCRIEVERL